MRLSIIIPAYNEEKRLNKEKILDNYVNYFSKIYKNDFEIIVVLNGCKDDTLNVVKQAAKKFKQIKYLDIKEAIGKGGAVVEGFKLAKGDLIGFVDADQSTHADAFYDLVKKIDGFDCIIASRYMKESIVNPSQPFFRRIPSIVFNLMVRALFCLNFKDTQCGAKLTKKDALKSILNDLSVKKWAFDIDLLYCLKKKRFSIVEVPTVWSERTGSKLTFKTPYEMFMSILKLRLNHSSFARLHKFRSF